MKRIRKFLVLLMIVPFFIFLASCDNFLNFDNNVNNNVQAVLNYINKIPEEAVIKTVRVDATYYKTKNDYLNDNPSASSTGTGVIYKREGTTYYLLTNNHVTSKTQYKNGYTIFKKAVYSVVDAFNNSFTADVLYSDVNYDLSLMKFERGLKYEAESKLGVFEFSYDNLNTSSLLCAIGECLGQRNSCHYGYYKNTQKFTPAEETTLISNVTFNVIVHGAYINSGSSGGALVDENLKLVGINFASASIESTSKYLYTYAIPAQKAKEFINNYNEGLS